VSEFSRLSLILAESSFSNTVSRLGREIECPEYPASHSHPSSISKSNLIDDKNQLELEPVVTWNVDFLVICGNDAIGLDKADDETLGWPM
jgi:hypothetical protein